MKGYLFRETVKLQVVTKGGVMQVVEGHGVGGPVEPRGIPFERVEELGLDGIESVGMTCVRLLGRVEDGATGYEAVIPGPDRKTYRCELIDDWDQRSMMRRLEDLAKTHEEDREKLRGEELVVLWSRSLTELQLW